MAYISLVFPPLIYMVLQMQIGQVVLMITSLRWLSCLLWLDADFMEIKQATHSCSLLYRSLV